MTAIWVEVTATRGSAPRDAGTVMRVARNTIRGTIGGGALEHQAIAIARRMLRSGDENGDLTRTFPLGPDLGQCCGGAVTLLFTRAPRTEDTPRVIRHPEKACDPVPLWVWGAGHVGRAMIRQAAPTSAFDITWVDDAPDRFPKSLPDAVTQVPAADMPRLVPHAPNDAHHLILTYSHDIDLALCAALLRHRFAYCGLIGSQTKKSRFASRLQKMGLDPATITCPIGDKRLGKHPDLIAAGTILDLLSRLNDKETA